MWKFVGDGTLLGVPARDLSDEEYAEYAAKFEEREGVTLASTNFYVQDKPTKAVPASAPATSEGE